MSLKRVRFRPMGLENGVFCLLPSSHDFSGRNLLFHSTRLWSITGIPPAACSHYMYGNNAMKLSKIVARGVLNKCLYGEAPPRGPTPYPFIYHFSRERYPFRTPSIDKWYPFYIPCLQLCISFNCCKCAVF